MQVSCQVGFMQLRSILGHPGVLLHHTLGQLDGEVHRLEDVLNGGTLQTSRLPGLTWKYIGI